jgi:cytochrome c oxidase subunit 3
VIGGLSALGHLIYQHTKVFGDPIKELIFFTNPFEKTKTDLVSLYWHFTDAVWLILFVYFLLTF